MAFFKPRPELPLVFSPAAISDQLMTIDRRIKDHHASVSDTKASEFLRVFKCVELKCHPISIKYCRLIGRLHPCYRGWFSYVERRRRWRKSALIKRAKRRPILVGTIVSASVFFRFSSFPLVSGGTFRNFTRL